MYTTSAVVATLAAVSGVMANNVAPSAGYLAYPAKNMTAPTPVWQYYNMSVPTTVVVPEFTTVCPEATTMTWGGVHYSATKGQTITVTDCPCTITKAVQVMTSSLCAPGTQPTGAAPAPPAGHPKGVPAPPAGSVPVPPGAAPAVPGSPSPATPNTPAASGSGVYPAHPTGVQVAGAVRSESGIAAALFAAVMGVLAL
ncbi:uncharacterized protein F4822DRAFT_319578 [Hypoxylon trugodes]|uniref:uncharacterized protein n=1 Tax=Hypoxylon trugodes TaxID=326681 RepID=UPI002198F5FD|nr:uncharacterized protein F4822DRAFT_319578 [Hypoxylon trugodes]KAI1386543.1 hypothetical protein F4822DRAFT_319578 [Hypoxylon trugodes]